MVLQVEGLSVELTTPHPKNLLRNLEGLWRTKEEAKAHIGL
jgi:hypothetical protein